MIDDNGKAVKSDKQGIPDDAVKIGEMRVGETPRSSSFFSKAAYVAGLVVSAISSGFVADKVSTATKEDRSAYDVVRGKSLLKDIKEAMKKGLKQTIDPKLWKSNLAGLGVMIGGVFITTKIVGKIEQNNFKEKYGTLPRQDQINQIPKGNFPNDTKHETSQSTNWQDKTRKTENAEHSVGI